jgi:hypothetical protein
MVDHNLADELRDACMTVALGLGGWAHNSKSQNANSKKSQARRAAAG